MKLNRKSLCKIIINQLTWIFVRSNSEPKEQREKKSINPIDNSLRIESFSARSQASADRSPSGVVSVCIQ